jgi:sRNA-binding carbon storage regulator CsrA
MQTNPSDLEIHRTELKEYVRLDEAKESFLMQKSRLQWLNLGDKN